MAVFITQSEWIKKMGLGGGMIWALDLDDFRNRCGCEPHPLLRTINRALRPYSVPDPQCPRLENSGGEIIEIIVRQTSSGFLI